MSMSASTEGVIAVFEPFETSEYGYLIYKLDAASSSSSSGEGARKGENDFKELGEPILSLKSSDYPWNMFFFSIGSKLYFTGGYRKSNKKNCFLEYPRETYMLDFNPPNKEDFGRVKQISPMNSGKTDRSWVFGPINGVEVYVISGLFIKRCSFELFNVSTNEWETLNPPPLDITKPYEDVFEDEGVEVRASALSGSNILLYTGRCLYVFSTTDRSWRAHPTGPRGNPFISQAHPLPLSKDYGHVVLAVPSKSATLPEIFTSPLYLPPRDTLDASSLFKHYGKVESLNQVVKEIPDFLASHHPADVYPLTYDPPRFCIIRYSKCGIHQRDIVGIDICSLHLLGDGKVKAENIVSYRYSGIRLMPLHFFEPASYYKSVVAKSEPATKPISSKNNVVPVPKSYASMLAKDIEAGTPASLVVRANPRQQSSSNVTPVPKRASQAKASVPTSKGAQRSMNSLADAKSIYIGNLPHDITNEELNESVKRFGAVKEGSIRIIRLQYGRCYAFLEFEKAKSAQSAVQTARVLFRGHEANIEYRKSSNQANQEGYCRHGHLQSSFATDTRASDSCHCISLNLHHTSSTAEQRL